MPSILFVHGAGHGSWCWKDHFTGWFQARGYHVAAPDLPHHGDLPRRGIRFASLKSYVSAVEGAAGRLDRPLILVGHSMGGFVIQKYLEDAEADLCVLLASIPPRGGSKFGRRYARRFPGNFLKGIFTSRASHSVRVTREMLFTPDTPDEIVESAHSRLGQESFRILMEMNKPIRTDQIGTPIVVLGADGDDVVVPTDEIAETAHAYATTPIRIPGAHDMMLDTYWEHAASAIDSAIAEHMPTIATAGGKPR